MEYALCSHYALITCVLGYEFWKDLPAEIGNHFSLPDILASYCDGVEPQLFVRQAYSEIFATLEKYVADKNITTVVVSGTPGVGKSYFLWYLLYKLKAKGEKVAMSLGKDCVILDDFPGVISIEQMKASVFKNYIYLHDPMASQIPALRLQAKCTIIATSEDPDVLKPLKHRDKKFLYMPPWSSAELKSCFSTCYQSLGLSDVVEKRFYYWGGSARHVFKMDDSSVHERLQKILQEYPSVAELIARLESTVHGAESTRAFQWLRHLVPSKDYTTVLHYQWPSRYICRSVLMQLPKLESTSLQRLKNMSSQSYIKNGNLYQDYVLHRLLNGSPLDADTYMISPPGRIHIDGSSRYALFGNKDAPGLRQNVYYIPLENNKETVDLVYPPWMLQITNAKDHTMKAKGIEAIKKAFPSIGDWKFCFIVPSRRKSNFKVTPIPKPSDPPVYIATVDYTEDIKFMEVQSEVVREEDEDMET